MVKAIAVGTDGSDTAQKAVDFALDMAERYQAKIVFTSAYVPVSESRLRREQEDAPEDIQWSINPSEEVDDTLRKVEEQAKERGLEYTSEARTGDPADVIVDIAADHDADVIVVGNKGMHGSRRFLLGSVPDKISHHASCSVLIVRTT